MSRLRVKHTALLLTLVGGVALTLPVFGERKPQSLLPPGFGQAPAQPQDDQPKPEKPKPTDSKPTDLVDDLKLNGPERDKAVKSAKAESQSAPSAQDALGNAVAAADEAAPVAPVYEIPAESRRTLAHIGLIDPHSGGMAAQAFGRTDGHQLEQTMRQTAAPIASRWVSIVLRRALLSDVTTPARLNGADWTAERAWLLLRMGEADSARMLIQRVDNENYTPKLISIAMQSALANADMAGFCPLVPQGRKFSDAPSWSFGRAICASLSGESGSASSLLREAESDTEIHGIDARLAERVIGAGKNTRHAVVIEWGDVGRLSAWRFGTATAVGLPIPAKLYETVRPNVRVWAARAPMLKLSDRADAADWAAVLGVYSSEALVDFYSALADQSEASRTDTSPQALLRSAYVGDTQAARMTALKALWTGTSLDPVHQYARLILTARAAARMPADAANEQYCDALAASMFTAGLDIQAQRWARIASDGSDDAARRAWGLLAVGAPTRVVDISERRIAAYRSTGDLRSRFLVAALAGLGRIEPGQAGRIATDYNVAIGQKSNWSQAIDAAAARGEQGTVALLAAQGMQSQSWSAVTPENLFHIIGALKHVGLEPEARMVAAEALTRA